MPNQACIAVDIATGAERAVSIRQPQGRARHSVRAAAVQCDCQRRARSDAPCQTLLFMRAKRESGSWISPQVGAISNYTLLVFICLWGIQFARGASDRGYEVSPAKF